MASFVAFLDSLTIFHTTAYSALFVELTHQHTAMTGVITALRKQVIEIKMVDRTRARHQHRATHRPRRPGGVSRSFSGQHEAPFALGLVVAPHTQPFGPTPLHALRLAPSPSVRTTVIRSPSPSASTPTPTRPLRPRPRPRTSSTGRLSGWPRPSPSTPPAAPGPPKLHQHPTRQAPHGRTRPTPRTSTASRWWERSSSTAHR